jgi:hypothetical protein
MARVSLYVALTALGGPGCLVTTSPDFAKPQITPPLLTDLSPAPYEIQQVSSIPGMSGSYPQVNIEFTVVSEDLGSPDLSGVLLKDFQGFGKEIEYKKLNPSTIVIPPGHLDSPTRHRNYSFGFEAADQGCHSVTLAVTHAFKDPGAKFLDVVKEGDLGTATWWYAVDVPDDYRLSMCIVVSGTPIDAGTDADARDP